jgi:hypothetical protein
MEVKITQSGTFDDTIRFLGQKTDEVVRRVLDFYGKRGVEALSEATPTRSGKTAGSWRYEIEFEDGYYHLIFHNDNINKYVNIALINDKGHRTRGGHHKKGWRGYVPGRKFIDPAIATITDSILTHIVREVSAK